MTLEQLEQAYRIYQETMGLSISRKWCEGIIDAKRAIYVEPSTQPYALNEIHRFRLPDDISEAVMAKTIELLTEKIKKLEEEFKKI